MDIVLWVLAGGIVGCICYSYLHFNEDRGIMTSVVIGAMGGFVGGKVIAPMFTAGALAGEFNVPALLFAAAVPAAFLVAGNLVYKRWRV